MTIDLELASSLTLSRLWTTYVVQQTEIIQKFAVRAMLELCTHCRYQHMRIELLFHVVFSTSCFEVHFVQYRRKKSDRLMMTSRSLYYNLSGALELLDSENIDAYGLVE